MTGEKVGISYATEQKEDVEEFIKELIKLDIPYFIDNENQDVLWGGYAPDILSKEYRSFKCVVAFVSEEYLKKAYPRFEMYVSFHNELHNTDSNPYFLPIVYENVKMPQFYRGFFYLPRSKYSIKEIAEILNKKLSKTKEDQVYFDKLDKIILEMINELIESLNEYVCEIIDKDIIIKRKQDIKKVFLYLKYDYNYSLYYILDEFNIVRASICYSSTNKFIFLNNSLLASVGNEYTKEELKIELKRLLEYDEIT